jgi:molybdopterin-containing oxidoreductase family iron-sulfur binding subunit
MKDVRTGCAIDFDAIRERLAHARGPQFWTSLEEIADAPAFQAWVEAEFPAAAEITKSGRREFLKLMGASFALAGLAGCSGNDRADLAAPFVEQPEGVVPGVPRFYATAVPFAGYAQPALATAYDGRPTKLDGNPLHPLGSGASDAFTQAAILQLYDPDRSSVPLRDGVPTDWADFEGDVIRMRANWMRSGGEGMRLLMGHTSSPTLARQVTEFLNAFPRARLHRFEPAAGLRDVATKLVFGQSAAVHYDLQNCDVVVGIDDDFLGPGPHQIRNASLWSQRRGESRPGRDRMRTYVAECTPTLTGAIADRRLMADASRLPALVLALAAELGVQSSAAPALNKKEGRWVSAAARDLRAHAGRSLLAIGEYLPPQIQALAPAVNQLLGNANRTIRYSEPILALQAGGASLGALVSDMRNGAVDTLVILDCNPAYAAPAGLLFADALGHVRERIHLGFYADETARLCQWHVPVAHALESWSDGRAADGTQTIIQPVITPFYNVRNIHQLLDILLGEMDSPPDSAVRATWRNRLGEASDPRWLQALHDGFVSGDALQPLAPMATPMRPAAMPPRPEDMLDIVFRPDPCVWDGRFANIGWLQELPKPLTKLTWENAVLVSPQRAERAGLANGDMVEIAVDGRSLSGPAWIMPGQAPNTITLFLGYGRTHAGHVGDGAGYNAYTVRPSEDAWHAFGTLRRIGTQQALATTQIHHRMDGFDFVREVTAAMPALAQKQKPPPTLYDEWPSAENAWAMVIDLDLCIGCNACVAACTAENNIAIVGKDQVAMGREMQWIRVDRYYSGDIDDPRNHFQPVPCMHCEKAPCEMGCPVHATVHNAEGINQQIYNRCIGTRTCSSYCPYKVRRFNWYDYTGADDPSTIAAHNPDVTVRGRGVMEKCTYCIQRIEATHVLANKENRGIRDGEVVTACQQACPTSAIVFGDLKQTESAVAKRRRSERHYALLEELGTRPRTTYLAAWKDEEAG